MENKKMPTWKIIIFTIVLFILVGILTRAFENQSSAPTTIYSEKTYTSEDSAAIVTSVDTNITSPTTANWQYSEDEDKMTSKKNFYAQIDANDILQFNSPYDGWSVASLTIRNRRGKNNVIIQVSKGQFLTRSYEGTEYYVRFDNKPATKYSFSGPTDGSSDVAFISNSETFIRKLKKAKSVIIEMEFYSEGKRQMEFNVQGFKWSH